MNKAGLVAIIIVSLIVGSFILEIVLTNNFCESRGYLWHYIKGDYVICVSKDNYLEEPYPFEESEVLWWK